MNQNQQRFRRPPNMQRRPQTAVQSALSKYFAQDFFTYVIPITDTIAAGGTTDGNVTLDADSDFLWQKFTFLATLNSDGSAIEQNLTKCGIIITDTGSGRNLSNSTVPLSAFAGSGELPPNHISWTLYPISFSRSMTPVPCPASMHTPSGLVLSIHSATL